MAENNGNNHITLRCNQLDPKNPDVLSCQILRNPVPSEKESSSIPSPDHSVLALDAATPSSDVTDDAGQQGYEMMTVRPVEIAGEKYLKIVKPDKDPEPVVEATAAVKKTPPDLQDTKQRFSRLKGCKDKRCTVSRTASVRPGRPVKRDDTGGEGK